MSAAAWAATAWSTSTAAASERGDDLDALIEKFRFATKRDGSDRGGARTRRRSIMRRSAAAGAELKHGRNNTDTHGGEGGGTRHAAG
jgi:hypothetical protein